MEMEPNEIVLVYLLENGSFDLDEKKKVSTDLTKEAVSLKCCLTGEELEDVLCEEKNRITQKKRAVLGRKNRFECLFLTSKGVVKAKGIQARIKDHRVNYINEEGVKSSQTLDHIKKEMRGFGIVKNFFDLFMISRRDSQINILEFLEKKDWKKRIFSDHAFPDMIFISNTSSFPFGGIFTSFGEPGLVLPINKQVEVGIHPFGEGNVIRWMKRTDDAIEDAFHIEGKMGLQSLTSGHSQVVDLYEFYKSRDIFKDEVEFKSYFKALKKYDYSIIFSAGTGHGISLAGHIGAILAAISLYMKDGNSFPFNGEFVNAENSKVKRKAKTPVWDFGPLDIPMTIMDMIENRHQEKKERVEVMELFKKYVTLSQIFERHWNSSFSKKEMKTIAEFQKVFNLREFSSGGACISTSFGSPCLLHLEKNGSVSLDSRIFPDMARNRNIGLIIDRKGGIDDPRKEFNKTFHRFFPLITSSRIEAYDYFSKLRSTSGSLSKLASSMILESQKFANPESDSERRAISAIITLQKGIYSSLGIENESLWEVVDFLRDKELDIGIGPVGVGNSGTYFFCLPDHQSMHTLKSALKELNRVRGKREKLEIVTYGSSHSYIFDIDPLVAVKK